MLGDEPGKTWRDVPVTWKDISDLFMVVLVLVFMYFFMPELTVKISKGMVDVACPPCPTEEPHD